MKYLKYKLILFLFLSSLNSYSQPINSTIEDIINETNLDTLVNYVNVLTGEDSVTINDSTYLIISRASNHPHNDIAAEYIKQTLSNLDLTIYDQKYSTTGRNILGIQIGTEYPDQEYIICAHYDAVTSYCADDNASSVAAVLEAARILSKYNSKSTIIYALWDEEEIGLVGSKYYANRANLNNENILGVINLEMLGWDSNNDSLFDIHTRDIENSVNLANIVKNINEKYEIGLVPNILNPGVTASDHGSFWSNDYSAIVFGEAFFGGDGNPYYHTSQDRIDKFNLKYYHKLSKLAVATISYLAIDNSIVEVASRENQLQSQYKLYQNFPNPFNSATMITYDISNTCFVSLNIYDILGKQIMTLVDEVKSPGKYNITLDAIHFSSGTYLYKLNIGKFSYIRRMTLIK